MPQLRRAAVHMLMSIVSVPNHFSHARILAFDWSPDSHDAAVLTQLAQEKQAMLILGTSQVL